MNRARLLGAAFVTAVVLATAGACPSTPNIQGTITGKYMEDFTEPTLVMTATDGTVHHFTVTQEQYDRVVVNQAFNTSQLETASDD